MKSYGSTRTDLLKALAEQLNEAERAALQDLRTMTRKQLEEENLRLQKKVKDQDLRQLLEQISRLSIPEISEFLNLEKQKKSPQQIKQKKKHELSLEEKRFKEFITSHTHFEERCAKYIPKIKILEVDKIGTFDSLKKLKKIILDRRQEWKNPNIYYSTEYPMLLFSFLDEKNQNCIKHIVEMIKEIPTLRYKGRMFDDIFGRIYERVDNKYHQLVCFALERVKETGLKTTEKELLEDSEDHPTMFYYSRTQNKQVNFTIFDKSMKCYEFSSEYIIKKKSKHLNQFVYFELLYNDIYGEAYNEDVNDLFDNQEAESDDEDRPRYQSRTLESIQEEVDKYLKKDLSQLEEEIDKLGDEVQIQGQKDSSSPKMQQLTERLCDLEENRQNFEKVRSAVKSELKLGYKNSYLIGLKKLIMASKQLESQLPIIGKKRKIFEMLNNNKQNLLIIEGETGSGKSTQFPQILCQYYRLFDNPDAKPVLVTQPRRLATRSLAERVAKQMGQFVGDFVDYVASAGKTVKPQAKIVFKLDRIVLDQLTEDPLLSKYSCLVIDQAHERTISIDVILGLIKQLLEKRKDFKVIVTSASMDIQLFEKYFKTRTLKVSGRMYPVTINYRNYLDIKEDKLQTVRKIQRVINEQILADSSNMRQQYKGHLLCFCSGVEEISELVRIFEKKLNSRNFSVLPLHGKISPIDQRKVFEATGKHKFIFASRIAETAITIDGVKVVIDPGQDIQMVYDQKHKISSMKLVNISQSSAKQRAGRSGRTAPGHCFRLYSEDNFKERKVSKVPEMENSSLETVVLRLKALKIKNVIRFPYLSKPDEEGLINSLDLLKIIGALDGKTEQITKIGELLIKIPIEPFLSRAIVEGILFQNILKDEKYSQNFKHLPQTVRDDLKKGELVYSITVILSLLVNFSNLFFIKKDDRQTGQAIKFTQFSDEQGDFFFLDNIYRKYQSLKNYENSTYSRKGNIELRQWIRSNFLNFKTLYQSEDLVEEISKIINLFKVDETYYNAEIKKSCSKIKKCSNFREIVMSCLITSFSSNLCKYSGNPHLGYTIVNQKRPVQIYGTSNLSLLGIQADWIISYDLYTNQLGRLFCKVAHKVSFDFIKEHTDEFLQQRFKIHDIQVKNPFYQQIKYQLPTAVLTRVKAQFGKGKRDEELQFLQETFPVINQDKNQIYFYILVDKSNNLAVIKKEDKISSDFLISKLKKYIQEKLHEVKAEFKHNYIGNIYIHLKDGFKISKIDFNRKEYKIEVVSLDYIIDYLLFWWSGFEKRQVYQVQDNDKVIQKFKEVRNQYGLKRIILYIMKEEEKQQIVQQIENFLKLREDKNPIIYYAVNLLDERKKVPRTKVYLHYFAGTSAKTIFMFYSNFNGGQDDISEAQQMCYKLQEAESKLLKKINTAREQEKEEDLQRLKVIFEKMVEFDFDSTKLAPSQKKNGVNLFKCKCDEFELKQLLNDLLRQNILDFRFVYPRYINKFREPDLTEAAKDDATWKKQITKLLKKSDIETQGKIINVRGYHNFPKNAQISQLERTYRVTMTAEILGISQAELITLRKQVDGKQKLGCQKVHVRANFDQVIAFPSKKLFDAFEQEYKYQLSMFEKELPMLSFYTIYKRVKSIDKVLIVAFSPNKEDFINPQRILSAMYTPKYIKLEAHEFNFLDKMSAGWDLLQNIQAEYRYKVYFGLDRSTKIVKVYCQDKHLKEIEGKIKESIKIFEYYCQKISYRGKNLKKIKQLLKNYSAKSEQSISYQILFQKRQIELTANYKLFDEIKNKINSLSDVSKGECEICCETMKSPFRLVNCECIFCWHCMAQAIRQFFSSTDQIYYCPGEKCYSKNVPINAHDFKSLLSEEQFQKLCDQKIREHLNRMDVNSKEKSFCILCKFCDNIMDRKDVDENGEVNCEICGKSWCSECNVEHIGLTCAQAKVKKQIGFKNLEKMGIKQCPKCKTGIQKNKGCNHIECRNCQTHICWKCLNNFSTSKKCYDHLSSDCGGVFDPDADEF